MTVEQWNSVDEVLDFAIKNEEEAEAFYIDLAGKMDNPAMKSVFTGFAAEEAGHKAKLLKVKSSGGFEPSKKEIMDLKIGDYLVTVDVTDDLTYQDALIVAMKKEKAAFKLYMDLHAKVSDPELKNLMLALAQEEAKHKLRFEVEYDDRFQTEM
jgi:rubrerythrin